MSSKSKNKGKSWERDVCLFLSELYNDSFIRVPNSGAYTGGKNEHRKEYLTDEQIKLSRGDIVPPKSFKNFVAECKNYAEFPFHQLISTGRVSLLDSWIEQVEGDSEEKDTWLLFIKITRKGTYVLYPISNNLFSLARGVRYRQYWFCEMQYFFHHYKDTCLAQWTNSI
tara:strand:+ start:480 stop:986 length:507 start_codon:yes stop_codon:yes gene_type:complete